MTQLSLGITAQLISRQAETLYLSSSPLLVLAKKHHLMLRFGSEVAAEVTELSWVIAVDKENAHNYLTQPCAIEQNRL